MKKRIVTITGGTGGSVLLTGLRDYNLDITAIAMPFDSSGSAGAIRSEFGGVSWGDIRRCLAALSPDIEPYSTLKRLIEQRFGAKSTFSFVEESKRKGHNFGNILLLALEMLEGSQEGGLRSAHRLFGLYEGRQVLPSTFEFAEFKIKLENSDTITGGRQIEEDLAGTRIERLYLDRKVSAPYSVIQAILEANMIVVGPGALYNSVIPNLLVRGIPKAIVKSKAKTVYVCNIATEFRQTQKMKGSDFVKEISKYLGKTPSASIFNDPSGKRRFGRRGKPTHREPVRPDLPEIKATGTIPLVRPLTGAFLDRHDSALLAKVVVGLL